MTHLLTEFTETKPKATKRNPDAKQTELFCENIMSGLLLFPVCFFFLIFIRMMQRLLLSKIKGLTSTLRENEVDQINPVLGK